MGKEMAAAEQAVAVAAAAEAEEAQKKEEEQEAVEAVESAVAILGEILDAVVTASTRAEAEDANDTCTALAFAIVHDTIQVASHTHKTEREKEVAGLYDENELLISTVTRKDEEEGKIRKRAAAEAEFRVMEAELAAKKQLEETVAAGRQKAEDELAESRRQEERERMALARTAITMQKLFRGAKARGFARDLREMRVLQLTRFQLEERKNARDAVIELQRRVPLPVLDFKQQFHAILDKAWTDYKEKTTLSVATPDPEAHTAMSEEILALWAGAAIANEAAIAKALVDSARTEVRKGLVLGRLMRGALERESLNKGLDKVNSIAQECLSCALREHLPLAPETVEERMASLKISIEAKKRLQTYVELECNTVMREMAELTRSTKSDLDAGPLLMGVLACADPGSALRQWEPLSYLPGDLNGRMLKSRQRATTKESIRDQARAVQQRWQALEANLDHSRAAFTNSVLGISGGRGWDCVPAKSKAQENASYTADLADALSYPSPPSSAVNPTAPRVADESRILKRRVANLFAPKRVSKPNRSQPDAVIRGSEASNGMQSPWPDWEPGKFRRKDRDSQYAQYRRRPEPHFITEVDLASPELPSEQEWDCEIKPYTVLPRIVAEKFHHTLSKLDKEIDFRREGRDERSQRHPSPALREERWQHIRHISKMEPGALPTRELFPTPRRLQKCVHPTAFVFFQSIFPIA